MRYLIVGGTSGIGRALVEKLEEDHDLILLSRKGSGESACDVLDFDRELPKIEGPLNGLVYLPGTINLKPFASLSIEDFKRDFEINCLGAVRVIQHFLPQISHEPRGSIVLVTTVAVDHGFPFHTSIAAAKGAVGGLTRSLAAELAPRVRVNAVAPSLTETPLSTHLLSTEQKKEQSAKRHPLKTIGKPEEVAAAIAFLLSEEASWMSGQTLAVDGGLSTIIPLQ